MADTVTKEVRSRMMSAIRGKDTQPELAVRRGLHALGFRYSLHAARLPGRPDMVLPKHRAVIWVHGCYWHGHDCRAGRLPETRREFWEAKIGRNRERDAEAAAAVGAMGWRSLAIWECALRGRTPAEVAAVIAEAAEWLRGGSPSTAIRG